MKTRKYVPYLYMLPGLLMVLSFVYIPVFMNIGYSFFRLSSYSAGAAFVGLDNYRRFFTDEAFPVMLKNNGLYCIISLIVQVGFGTILALIIESTSIAKKIKGMYRNIYFMPSLISLVAVGLMFTFIYDPNVGFLNALLKAMHLPGKAWLGDSNIAIYCIIAMSQWQFTGYIALLMCVAFQNVPEEYSEAAAIDGAGPVKRAVSILIPQAKEQLLVCSIITVIGAFKLYTEVYSTTGGGPGNSTQVLGLFLYQQAFLHDDLGMAAVTGVFIFVITVALSVLQLKVTNSGKD
ncbi:carbohydrate ABC transporter permease [Caproiciproducens galactitolivorans]|uniref:Sugar ABC transporter permease n=1 Tax=Caproiciproducens galactitolivorans TaxID=642589 RepID=A0ABT4BUY6_9FIRM|nr:sugar ABC transporter permease [Caproiciproducens galactitolivorans]MCY1714708.1 sugar ABC transporter permease [Caproiciproducens galactitolivorans]